MPEDRSDLELVKQLKAGSAEAYEEMLRKYSDKVFSLASRMCRNPEDAQEVIQDVFVTVYRKIGSFEGKSSFSSWLYRVAVNASLMKIRKRKQDQSVALEDVLQGDKNTIVLRTAEERDADNIALRREVLNELQNAISTLPEDYRPVYILRDIDGLTSREVGKILNLTIPAVKSRLHRSRLMLRRKLAGFYREYASGSVKIPLPAVENL